MNDDPADVSRDLTLILEGSADFESRARLEHHLLNVVRSNGLDALATLLKALPNHRFETSDDVSKGTTTRLVSPGSGSARLVVDATLDEHIASVDISVLQEGESTSSPDPRHQAFYEVWEGVLGTPDSKLPQLDSTGRTVFLVGLLESEVMNGGLGQYLANTEGAHIDETLACLGRVGASHTRTILVRAAALGAAYESFAEAWDERSADFARLDEEFLETGEDLAGLTASAILDVE